MTDEEIECLKNRLFRLHLEDLRMGNDKCPADLDAALQACLAIGRRDIFIQARRDAGRVYSDEIVKKGDDDFRREHGRTE